MQRKVPKTASSTPPPPSIPSRKPVKSGWRSSHTAKLYLAVYNSMLAFVWGSFLYTVVKTSLLAYFASSSSQDFWQRRLAPLHQGFVDFLIQIQCLSSIDVIHAGLGLTPSGFLQNLLQNFSRLAAVIVAAKKTVGEPSPFVHAVFLAMAIAWAKSDVIRYSYYIQNYLAEGRKVKGWLTWARYTAFIWLYPIGASAEAYLFSVFRKQLIANGSPWAPLVLTLLAAYPFGFVFLYGHMLRQRSKNI